MKKRETEYAVSIGDGGLVYNVVRSKCGSDDTLGVEVKCRLFGTDDTVVIEDISPNFQMVKELINLMAENLVTPCTAKDVAEDFIISKHDVLVSGSSI
ncbi:MAG: hypothetical protein GX967_01910 [Clostridiales bacterium]|nr:hypothetical protein [Clostridiales bacterium]